jgi:selenocysteine lyase/cysteine desulfurase
MLKLKDQQQIVFAPNTHELVARLLSLFLGKDQLHVLTTSSEFHSWRRQMLRLEELPQVKVTVVSTEDLLLDRGRFIAQLKNHLAQAPDVFFISHVFFDSGIALTEAELLELCQHKSDATMMVIDGYHAFAAIPTDLSRLEGKVFYLAGGYKYAQAGEGVGFMLIPKGDWRPAFTGWFAEYANLSQPAGTKVGYADNWMAFMGATQDASGFYRFLAVWDQFNQLRVGIKEIHQHVKSLQQLFLQKLPPLYWQKWQLTQIRQTRRP